MTENAFENIVCEMSTTLSRSKCVKYAVSLDEDMNVFGEKSIAADPMTAAWKVNDLML